MIHFWWTYSSTNAKKNEHEHHRGANYDTANQLPFLNVNMEFDNLMDRGKEFPTLHVSGTKEYKNEFVCANGWEKSRAEEGCKGVTRGSKMLFG